MRVLTAAALDVRMRMRRRGFLMLCLILLVSAFGFVPRESGVSVLVIEGFRPLSDPSWIPTACAQAAAVFLPIAGFVYVRTSLDTDRRTGVAAGGARFRSGQGRLFSGKICRKPGAAARSAGGYAAGGADHDASSFSRTGLFDMGLCLSLFCSGARPLSGGGAGIASGGSGKDAGRPGAGKRNVCRALADPLFPWCDLTGGIGVAGCADAGVLFGVYRLWLAVCQPGDANRRARQLFFKLGAGGQRGSAAAGLFRACLGSPGSLPPNCCCFLSGPRWLFSPRRFILVRKRRGPSVATGRPGRMHRVQSGRADACLRTSRCRRGAPAWDGRASLPPSAAFSSRAFPSSGDWFWLAFGSPACSRPASWRSRCFFRW